MKYKVIKNKTFYAMILRFLKNKEERKAHI